jgi:plastocyanin
MRNRTIALAALLAGSITLAACGDDDADNPLAGSDTEQETGNGEHDHDEDAAPVADGARRIEVTATDLSFDPPELTAKVGEDLAVVLTSEDMLHDFTIDELDAHVAADRGETTEGGVTADESGTYTYYCSVPGHRDAGMEGTLTVTDA